MQSIAESESNDVEKKIQESRAKRECTNEAFKMQLTMVKNEFDTCKSKVEKIKTEHGRFPTASN